MICVRKIAQLKDRSMCSAVMIFLFWLVFSQAQMDYRSVNQDEVLFIHNISLVV